MPNRTTTSFDGVCIAYSVSGAAETALIFIHGGMSDRSFWDGQHAAFAERFRVIALDLAGHGESGQSRQERMSRMPLEAIWSMFRCFGGYDTGAPGRKLPVPVCIPDAGECSRERRNWPMIVSVSARASTYPSCVCWKMPVIGVAPRSFFLC